MVRGRASAVQIGELAIAAGVSTRSLRYYEAQGLIDAERRANGYRDYSESTVARVRNIRLLLDAGLDTESLRHIHACLDEDLERTASCETAVELVRRRLEVINERIDGLANVRDRLEEQLRHLAGQSRT